MRIGERDKRKEMSANVSKWYVCNLSHNHIISQDLCGTLARGIERGAASFFFRKRGAMTGGQEVFEERKGAIFLFTFKNRRGRDLLSKKEGGREYL